MAKQKQTGLGRGLGSLIPKPTIPSPSEDTSEATSTKPTLSEGGLDTTVAESDILEVSVDDVHSNTYQPRKYFSEKHLNELADSIKEHGVLQPLVVIPRKEGGYELIAGERRLRASKQAGKKHVPIIVRQASELERLELALIENIQRADLNPIEEAWSYQKLNDEFGLTHEQVAKRVGKSRSTITNALRMLQLPENIQQAIAEGKITEGHAKVLMEIKDEDRRAELFERVLKEKLTITDTAEEVKKVAVNRHTRTVRKDPTLGAYEQELRGLLGTKVSIKKRGKHAGIVQIEYYGDEEFQALLEKLRG